MTRAELVTPSGGPWSRFASAFAKRASSRWAWRALVFVVGLAVFAPLIANDRPFFARFRDVRGYDEARVSLAPIARDVAEEALAGLAPEPHASHGALRRRLGEIEALLAEAGNAQARASIASVRTALEKLEVAEIRTSDALELRECASGLSASTTECAKTLELPTGDLGRVRERIYWPIFASLSTPGGGPASGDWKARIAADREAIVLDPPSAFGPSETDLSRALEAPFAGDGPVHVCGTDALGRDLLARMLYAGRTSFAAALLAAFLIVSVGALLGLAAGTLRGFVDVLVSRAIEGLQSLPTLVLLLGIVALLPQSAGNSRWTIPLVIAAVGWTHVARLARAEALRVGEMPFVQAATAAGFSRARVLGRHVLPNSLGPVWIAASFVLSAGLVLESSAAFLGFGVQHPAPSFGGLLAEARGGDPWWLALFPGLWLFAAILAIHLVGEGVRDALDPRSEGERP